MLAALGAATVRMIDRIHGDATVVRHAAPPTLATCLADGGVHVVGVRHRPDRRHAAAVHQALLRRVEPQDHIVLVAAEQADIKPGNAMPVGNMPVGTIVHNVELKIGKGGQIARSAGTYAQIVGRDQQYVILRLNSTEQRLVHGRCMATVGAVSNPDNMNITIGKAGRQRWKGRMPHNRGVTMNPIDHPHGGGEGRTSGGRHPVTPWGKPTKGKKTRSNKATDKFILRSRHQRKS